MYTQIPKYMTYCISGNFRVGLIFAEFATSLKPKIDNAKNKSYFTSSLKVIEIAKIWLGEKLIQLPSVIFAKISRQKKFPIYGNSFQGDHGNDLFDYQLSTSV